jgi:hypothetical protein
MDRAKVTKKRIFFPYSIYLDTAEHFYAEVKRKEHESWYDLMACMTTTAFSVEAILNTFGHIAIKDFGDFESCSPLAKMRILCEELKIEFNKSRSPFNSIVKLLKLRNKFAHPKFKILWFESEEMDLSKAQALYNEGEMLHELEKALKPELVKASLQAVKEFENMVKESLGDNLPTQASERKLLISGNS